MAAMPGGRAAPAGEPRLSPTGTRLPRGSSRFARSPAQHATVANPTVPGKGKLTIRFILTAAGVYATAGGLAYFVSQVLPTGTSSSEAILPRIFWLTTAVLIAGSWTMQRGLYWVRRERQSRFRRSLLAALVLGVLFVGLQGYGLRCLIRHQDPAEAQTGANAFLTMLAALHAMHFTLALLLLVWVTQSALADRYDHEYHWGVSVCAWFWHALGVVWLAILVVFLIATR